MDKVSPCELRVSIKLSDEMSRGGMGWIPIPYGSDEERANLIKQSINRLEELAIVTEEEERDDGE